MDSLVDGICAKKERTGVTHISAGEAGCHMSGGGIDVMVERGRERETLAANEEKRRAKKCKNKTIGWSETWFNPIFHNTTKLKVYSCILGHK